MICLSTTAAAAVVAGLLTQASPTARPMIETQDDQAHQIRKLLRCPVCQGMPISESPSEMAQDMMKRVRTMVAEGKSQPEIINSFVGSYGEWILLRPKARGFNLGLWILPILALCLGALLLGRYVRQRQPAQSQTDVPTAGDRSDDPYIRAIRDEVEL